MANQTDNTSVGRLFSQPFHVRSRPLEPLRSQTMNSPSFSFFICGVDSKVSFVNKLHHGKRNTLYRLFQHYVKGMNVAVVDCDYPQHSIAEMRKRDLKTVMEDEHYKLMAYRQLQRIRKKAYPIAESTAEDAVAKADELLEKMPETDIVFFDLPGTVNSTGVLNTLANMDYVFSPIAADRVVMESTLRFASRLNDTLIATGKTNIKGLYLLWNMVDGREKSELYKVYEQVIGELGLKVLNTFLPDSKRFRRELTGEHRALFRSTLFPADGTLVKGSNLKEITEELLSIIKK